MFEISLILRQRFYRLGLTKSVFLIFFLIIRFKQFNFLNKKLIAESKESLFYKKKKDSIFFIHSTFYLFLVVDLKVDKSERQ